MGKMLLEYSPAGQYLMRFMSTQMLARLYCALERRAEEERRPEWRTTHLHFARMARATAVNRGATDDEVFTRLVTLLSPPRTDDRRP